MSEALERLVAGALPGGSATWFQDLLGWVLAEGPASERTERLLALRAAIDAHPMRDVLVARIAERWNDPSMVRFLAEIGIPTQLSLSRELLHRASASVLPRLRDEQDIGETLADLDVTPALTSWLDALPLEAAAAWGDVLPSRTVLIHAARLVAVRAAGAGLSPYLLHLAGNPPVQDSPFLDLAARLSQTVEAEVAGGEMPDWQEPLARARRHQDWLAGRLDQQGVSAESVFQLELLDALLARLGALMLLATRPGRSEVRHFTADLLRAVAAQRSIGDLVRTAQKRLARKIVEYTGAAGADYTVRTRAEWRAHRDGSLAAGFLTTFTSLGKYAISAVPLAPFVAGLSYWANYSASFCLMQVNHWQLASKQPAMTAAALAAALEDQSRGNEDEIALIAGITRSQVVVTLGNAVAAMSLALLLDSLVGLATGHRILPVAKAQHGLDAIHPFKSLTVVFAATTGVSLWLASLAAGWAANWSTFRRLPEAIRRDGRVQRLLGRRGAERAGDFTEHHFSGIVGYIVLGMLLGFLPVLLAKFFGIGLEVRHITLQAASVAFCWLPLFDAGLFGWRELGWSLAGIALTGLINFGVSFALALRTALRARDLRRGQRQSLWRDLWRAVLARPGLFLGRPEA
jgi:site-specific recombinase